MKKLLVISNHNPNSWSAEQKAGWDEIKYIPFPNIPPTKNTHDIINDEVTDICGKIGKFYAECDEEGCDGYVNLQGEYSLCCYVYQSLANSEVNFTFPTTERVVEEVIKEDGSVEKKAIFKFVMWR